MNSHRLPVAPVYSFPNLSPQLALYIDSVQLDRVIEYGTWLSEVEIFAVEVTARDLDCGRLWELHQLDRMCPLSVPRPACRHHHKLDVEIEIDSLSRGKRILNKMSVPENSQHTRK